jgi:hypothetical protein
MARTDVRHAIDCPARASIAQSVPVSEPIGYLHPDAYRRLINGESAGCRKESYGINGEISIYAAPPQVVVAQHHLSNLLARIHRDGGHYEYRHGTNKAVADADDIVARLNMEKDEASIAPLPVVKVGEPLLGLNPRPALDPSDDVKFEVHAWIGGRLRLFPGHGPTLADALNNCLEANGGKY